MTLVTHFADLFAPESTRPRSLGSRFAARLCGTLLSASRQVALRRARREIFELPNEMLKDMGITRGEIDSVVEFGRNDWTRVSTLGDGIARN